jgi:DNA modification methylase
LTKRKIELSGKEWLKRSISVWDDYTWTTEERQLRSGKHSWGRFPALFPIDIARRIIEIYAPSKGWVLDPFAGSGSTLLASRELGRNAVGTEINPEFCYLMYKRLLPVYEGIIGSVEQVTDTMDSMPQNFCFYDEQSSVNVRKLMAQSISLIQYEWGLDYFDLCVTSPPYWDVHWQKRTADLKDIRPYSDDINDFGNMHDYSYFFAELERTFKHIRDLLRRDGHCVIIAMDIRKKNILYNFHQDIINMMTQRLGFSLEDIVIWDRRKDYNNLKPLGYPYVMRFNKVHEYIMIFKK